MNSKDNADLKAAINAIQKQWGPQALRRITPQMSYVATGFAELDAALGGGFPRGRSTELIGRPTCGMTTLAFRAAALAQQDGDLVVYIDRSTTFDPDYAARCGVNVADLLIVRPQTPDEALDMLFDVVASRALGLVIFNTVSGLAARQKQLLPPTLQRLHPSLTQSRCALLVLSQPDRDSTGISHLAAVRLRVEWEAWLYSGRDVCGYRARVTILKHRQGGARQSVSIQIAIDDSGA